ncbi:MAG: hypothetical protein KDJ73_01230 [Notoacmeibacter sp.]|nr:hypothetical protein [Notoacmeibacter sp.]MCC0031859.1 hypothetical protein [Brucellaceae bacterium]
MKAQTTLGDRIDRLGGKLVYRLAGLVISFMALGFGSGLWWALKAGDMTTILIFTPVLAGLVLFARWCFSPQRRLSDLDD